MIERDDGDPPPQGMGCVLSLTRSSTATASLQLGLQTLALQILGHRSRFHFSIKCSFMLLAREVQMRLSRVQ
jgi:hypothetical protein